MYRKTIKYTDYNGQEREDTFYFNLNKAELIKWEGSTKGGMRNLYDRIIEAKDTEALIELFSEIIRRSYGEKSVDGKNFRKSPEILDDFMSTEAYSTLFMELATDDQAATEFLNGVMPSDLVAEANKEMAKNVDPMEA